LIHFTTPYSSLKKLGAAYNASIRLIPDGDTNCIRDIDTLFLLPEQPAIIEQYANKYPDAVLTGYCNRLSALAHTQLLGGQVSEESEMRKHIDLAQKQFDRWKCNLEVTEINRDISGFLMVVPKSVWNKVPFQEDGKCLGVDTLFARQLRIAGIKILRMEAVYLWHTYRMQHGVANKTHLV